MEVESAVYRIVTCDLRVCTNQSVADMVKPTD